MLRASKRKNRIQKAVWGVEQLEQRTLLSSASFFVRTVDGNVGVYEFTGSAISSSTPALITGLNTGLGGMAIAGNDLFFTNPTSGTISEYTTSGAVVNTALVSGLSAPGGIAVEGNNIFVVEQGATGFVGEYTTSGAAVNASLISNLSAPWGISVWGTELFITSPAGNTVGEYTTIGGTVNARLLTTGLNRPYGLTVEGTNLFVINAGSGTETEFNTLGQELNPTVATGLSSPTGIAPYTDDEIIANNGGTVDKWDNNGTAEEVPLITGLNTPVAIAVQSNPGAETHLAFASQPTFDASGSPAIGSFTVDVLDDFGNIVTTNDSTITLSIGYGPTGAGISGTLTAQALFGVATFNNVTLTGTGFFTLEASNGNQIPALSKLITTDVGSVDSANMNEITGWAFDPANNGSYVDVEIAISGGPTQYIAADQSRPDLVGLLQSPNRGFTYATPMLTVGNHTANIYALVSGGPVLLATVTLTSQNSLFDEHYYLQQNPDVAAAVNAGIIATGYDHYIEYGQYEGRSPNPYWNESWYLQENPDVAAAVQNHTVSSGFMQYYLYGQYENRGGLLYFNTQYYLDNNPNVAAAITAGTYTSAFEHFCDFGQYQGLSPMLYFSSTVYDADNSDIFPYVTGEPFSSDFEQFIEYGQFEGRVASNYYNETTYLADNPDVAAAVQSHEFPDGFIHWLEYGQYEGRTAV
jgi:hypothetical protein